MCISRLGNAYILPLRDLPKVIILEPPERIVRSRFAHRRRNSKGAQACFEFWLEVLVSAEARFGRVLDASECVQEEQGLVRRAPVSVSPDLDP